MSVLINGMEMPSGCYTCPIIYSEDGAFDFECPFNSYFHWHNAEDVINYIPDSCLLVEVPTPHGRLIDADALLRVIEENSYRLRGVTNSTENGMFLTGIRQAIDESPTIIEAEVSE